MFEVRTGTRRWAAAGVVVLALGLAACGDDDDGGTTTGGGGGEETAASDVSFDMTIGDLVPLTGDLSVFGPAGRKAAELAVEQINTAAKEAGVDTTVTVEHADDETNPQAAVQAARQLISGGASCIAGDWASATTIAVGESVASRQRTPIISPASTSAEITTLDDNGFVFRTAPSDNLQAQALADVIEEELGTDATLSLAARNDAYGEGFITRFQEAWEAKGGTSTGPVLYDPEQPSYNSEAAEITSGNPDGYVIIDFPETFTRMGAALVRTGNYDASTLFTADGLAADSIPEGIPAAALRGARGTRPGTPEQGAVVDAFNEMWDAAGGPERGTFDAQNFDAVMLCYLAALAAGEADGTAISENLQDVSAGGTKYDFTQLSDAIAAIAAGEDVDFDGVTGPIDFDENGDPTAATYEVYEYAKNGDLEVLRQFEAQAAE